MTFLARVIFMVLIGVGVTIFLWWIVDDIIGSIFFGACAFAIALVILFPEATPEQKAQQAAESCLSSGGFPVSASNGHIVCAYKPKE